MASLWFYRLGTEQIGPVNANQIRSLAKAGTILPGTPIRRSDDANWLKAARIKGLFEGVQTVQRTEPEDPDEEAPDPLVALMSHAASSVVSTAGLAASAIGGAVSDWLTRRKDETSERANVPDPTPPAPIQATPSWHNSLWPATPNSALIGVTEAVCPYCAHGLEKMPGRKKKCPSCGNAIFVRTRPQDKSRILVREDQLLAVEEQWSVANGTHEQFLRSAFNRPVHPDKISILAARTFTDLEGVTDAMSSKITRTLVDGLIQGEGPMAIARQMNEDVENIGIDRAKAIARTELMRVHAEGQLDAMERLGVKEVGVCVEWHTAGDEAVCELCSSMEGVVLSVEEARGLLPRHVNCRCAYTPANVGEDKTGQKRTKAAIDKAIGQSVRAEVAESGKPSSWPGANRTIAQKRPKSILD